MFDAVRFFQEFNIRYWTEGKNVSPGWINTRCLFPGCSDRTNHLGWNVSEGYLNCWKCGRHSLEDGIILFSRTTFSQAKEIIKHFQILGGLTQQKKKAQGKSIELPGSELTKFHREYLIKRGFDPDYLIEKYGIKGTGPNERWEGVDFGLRIIIPIYYQGQLVSFQGRDITNKQDERYKNCPIEKSVIGSKTIFYNWDSILFQRAVLVEGVTDVWKLGDGFIAGFGTGLTTAQIRLLGSLQEVYLLFDPEEDAQRQARKYASQLSSLGSKTAILRTESTKDPGDWTTEEVKIFKAEFEEIL